ncbi:MAG: hypothetical protein RLZ94_1513 [Actinomycetota bacterium]
MSVTSLAATAQTTEEPLPLEWQVPGGLPATQGPGVVEASAVVIGGERARAVALRLEVVRGRWLATAIEMG